MGDYEELKEKLFYTAKNGRQQTDEETLKQADIFCEGYKNYLGYSKTERLAANRAIEMAKERGFSEYDYEKTYKPGDKVYVNH